MSDIQQREHAADRLRSNLLSGLSELERRRRHLTPRAITRRARDNSVVRAGVVVLGAGLAGGVFALAYWLKRRNRPVARMRRHMRARKDALLLLWRDPDRITKSAEPPLPNMLGRKVALIAVTALATAASKRGTDRFLPVH